MKSIPDYLLQLQGKSVDQIETPALVIDLDAMDRNIQRMADFTRKHRVRWRPHAKLHKSADIALLLEQAGAIGHCVQKLSEAEILASLGVNNLYISNEIIAPTKLRRVAQLAQDLDARGGRLAIAVDSEVGIELLARSLRDVSSHGIIDVFIELDVGQGRCGVHPGEPALELAKAIAEHPALRLAGLHAYHGRAQHFRTIADRRQAIAQVIEEVEHTRKLILDAGLQVHLITGSGTGTLIHEAASGVYGELQAGSFLFMDADYAQNERDPAQPAFEHSLFVKSQVISADDKHAVCDAGHKSHAIDSGLPRVRVTDESEQLQFANGGDEHGLLHPTSTGGWLPALGATVWLIPGHCDPTVNLHDFMIGVRGGLDGGVVESIIRVDARGALR